MARLIRFLLLVPALALLGLLALALIRQSDSSSITAALARGQHPAAPAFALPRLDREGTLALADLRGKVVVLNFWASWCVPCRDEMPLLQRLAETYRDRGVVVVGVNVLDLEPEARRFLRETGATFAAVRDRDGAVKNAYDVTGVPETFLIDPGGRIVRKFPGAVTEWSEWQSAVESALAAR